MNMMELIKGAVAQQAMDKLGGALGMDSKKASSAFDMASGALLGGIIKKATSGSDGAKSIFDMAKNTDTSMLDKLGDMFGSSGASTEAFQKAGGGILDSVLGGSKSGMVGAIAKALGLDNTVIGKLLTMVAPIVMGMLSKQIKSQGLDAAGLGNFLNSQKSSLGSVLPSNLMGDLGLGDLASKASSAVGGASKAAASAGAAADQAKGGLAKMLLPLLILAGLAFGAYKMFGGRVEQAVENVKNSAQSAVDGATNAVEGAKNVAEEAASAVAEGAESFNLGSFDFSALGESGNALKSGFGDITQGLTGLAAAGADEAGAKGVLDKITDFTGKLDGLGLDKVEGAAKTGLGTVVNGFMTSIQALLDKIPEPLKAIVQPAINGLLEKLAPFK